MTSIHLYTWLLLFLYDSDDPPTDSSLSFLLLSVSSLYRFHYIYRSKANLYAGAAAAQARRRPTTTTTVKAIKEKTFQRLRSLCAQEEKNLMPSIFGLKANRFWCTLILLLDSSSCSLCHRFLWRGIYYIILNRVTQHCDPNNSSPDSPTILNFYFFFVFVCYVIRTSNREATFRKLTGETIHAEPAISHCAARKGKYRYTCWSFKNLKRNQFIKSIQNIKKYLKIW